MNTIVLTVNEMDFGAGMQRRHTFVGCTHHIDAGTLHIVSQEQGQKGNVAAFAPGEWRGVVRGTVLRAMKAADGAA